MKSVLRSRLFQRQFISFFLIILVSFFIISGVLLTSTRITLLDQQLSFAKAYQSEVASTLGRWVHGRIANIRSQAELLSVSGDIRIDTPEFAGFLDRQLAWNTYFIDIVLIDKNGFPVATRTGRPGKVSLLEREYVQRGLQGLPTNTGFIRSSRSNRLIMSIAEPVFRNGQPEYVLCGIISLGMFVRVIADLELGKFGRVLVVDRDGNVIDGKAPDAAYSVPPAPRPRADIPEVIRNVISGNSGTMEYVSSGYGRVLGSYEWLDSLGLGLIVELSEKDVLEPVTNLMKLLWVVAGLVLVSGLVSGLLLARNIIAPITSLIEAAGGIIEQTWEGPLEIRTNSELDLLIDRFNSMREAIRQREEQLRRQQEEILVQKAAVEETSRLKSQFLANMSHELRTPLNSIIGFTGRVQKKTDGLIPESQRENLQIVRDEARHLLAIINDVLDFSKIEAGRMDVFPEHFDLGPLVRESLEMVHVLRGEKPIEFRVRLPENPLLLFSDRMKVKQILINLLSNAVKFSDRGTVEFAAHCQGPFCRFSVRDEGIGIAAENLQAIFDEFRQVDGTRTRKAGGTGLGLAITKRFVELLGGRIEVESTPGAGSTFTVTLPLEFSPEANTI